MERSKAEEVLNRISRDGAYLVRKCKSDDPNSVAFAISFRYVCCFSTFLLDTGFKRVLRIILLFMTIVLLYSSFCKKKIEKPRVASNPGPYNSNPALQVKMLSCAPIYSFILYEYKL